MAGIELSDEQLEALDKIHTGCVLNGDTGSGKTRVSLAYYYKKQGGTLGTKNYSKMINPKDLYVITTACTRDKLGWEKEMIPFYICPDPEHSMYNHKVVVDSWNNIDKYVDVKNAFFIFDEARAGGKGKWSKSFLKIALKNEWIMLSATPGDKWDEFIPLFIANGFIRNRTEFNNMFVVPNPWTPYYSVLRYVNEGLLIKWKHQIIVPLKDTRLTKSHHEYVECDYNRTLYNDVVKNRWNPFTNQPILNATEYCMCLRKIVNSDISRQNTILDIVKKHKKVIIFYSYDYELDILRELFKGIYSMSEWNGHLHQKIMSGDSWVYLVQYNAGNEGWNCVETDTMIFYSQSYSYKMMKQAYGRINRMNTPYIDLYYYHLISHSKIDMQINLALNRKKKFNEKSFAPVFEQENSQK